MNLQLYNSYTRKKEVFESITPGHAGMYVCGPTVSGESHLGHARPYITFDILYRYLTHLGYRVRYVRNITDAGHFEEEGREAEDKIAKKAQLEKLEPMELVTKYTNLFRWAMRQFNNIDPSIEPTATGHIVEQIEMIKKIIEEGYAYESNGSVYFDVKKYAEDFKDINPYGKLSGRVMDELFENTRDLDGQQEKRNPQDFALWKNAPPEHIQRWASPWGEGFPGWHIECSAMSAKYLGEQFDIHGGGMDLQFPHHESEIAQSCICHHGTMMARYWLHNNMITINGRKMGKSYNNVIRLTELFSGEHPLLEQAFHPMTIRFFILQSHYRSTLDFSNEALIASEKALKRLWEAYENLGRLAGSSVGSSQGPSSVGSRQGPAGLASPDGTSAKTEGTNAMTEGTNAMTEGTGVMAASPAGQASPDGTGKTDLDLKIFKFINEFSEFMNDDLNTAKVVANMFELAPIINGLKGGQIKPDEISASTIDILSKTMRIWVEDILGLQNPMGGTNDNGKLDGVMQVLIDLRKQARGRKDWATSDAIRNQLAAMGIQLKDEKDGTMSYSM
jgi:cysteinyl-tRNA synthetase